MQFGLRTSKMHGPLMTLSRNDIVEASLPKPTGEEHGTFPTLEKAAALLGKEVKPPHVPGSCPEQLEFQRFAEPAEQSTTPSASSPSPMPHPSCHPSQKAKKPQREIKAGPFQAGEWVHSYLQVNEGVPEWWREFRSHLCAKDECFGNIKVQGLAHWQAAAFRVPATQQERDGWWSALPCLSVLE